jgi:hypothetical protein
MILSAVMNPEFEVIVRLSRIHPTPADLARVQALAGGVVSWERVAAVAESHGTAPLVAANLCRLPSTSVPVDVQARLRSIRRASVVADLIRYRQWIELSDALVAGGVRAMSLRGFHVATAIYRQVGLRPVSNLEFLVNQDQLESATGLLRDAGYRVVTKQRGALTLTSTHGVVSLHCVVGPWATAQAVERLLDSVEALRVDGHDVSVAPKSLLVAMLVSHGCLSGWPRLRGLVDVVEGLEQLSSIDYQVMLGHLEAAKSARALDDALVRIETHWERLPAVSRGWARPTQVSVSNPPRPARRTRATLVSAIYNTGPTSILGGRGLTVDDHLASLIDIGKLGAPLMLFCAAKDVAKFSDAVAAYFCEYRVVPWELKQFEYFDAFVAWKQSYRHLLTVNDRNEVFSFLKSWWLQQAASDNPFNDDEFYWIDADVLGRPAGSSVPMDLETALSRVVPRGKVAFYTRPFPAGARRTAYQAVLDQRFGTEATCLLTDHLAGGFFGGHRDDLATLHQRYVAVLEALIESRTFALEEQVFSCVHALHPESFDLLRFD